MPKYDIIYILKDNIDPEELRYSLRSVEKNFPHNKVWFIGGKPKGFNPDGAIYHQQSGPTKWDQIKSSMWKAIECDEITQEFFLFNDDFFVMKPFKGKFVNYVDKELEDRIDELHKGLGMTAYCRTLFKAMNELRALKLPEHNFEVHLPMLVDKTGMAAALRRISSPQMRSAYGNVNLVPTVQHKDVKVYDLEKVPEDPDYLSTNDETFREGAVGKFIRESFPKPSRFEVR